jgi:hypothetical protein
VETAGLATKSAEYRDDPELLSKVLSVYKPHCRYLRSTTLTCDGEPRDGGTVSLRGEFAIPESCYIDDTGHFNAVEFNLCFNQMFYYLVAKCVREKAMWPLDSWSLDEFWDRQLQDVFIVDFRSTFRRQMSALRFWGQLDLVSAMERDGGNGPLVLVGTRCRFGDGATPASRGEVRLALRRSGPAG